MISKILSKYLKISIANIFSGKLAVFPMKNENNFIMKFGKIFKIILNKMK